jgi:hypothetical protein
VDVMQIRDIVVQTIKPSETFAGQVEEAKYTHENDIVTLVNADGTPLCDRKGQPYTKKLTPGEDPYTIAGRLTKQKFHDCNAKSEFWRPLTYKPINY